MIVKKHRTCLINVFKNNIVFKNQKTKNLVWYIGFKVPILKIVSKTKNK